MTNTMLMNNSKSNYPKLHYPRAALAWAILMSWSLPWARGEDPAKPLSVRPQPHDAEWAISWWMPRHEQKLKEKKDLKDCQVVWIGDSITHGWEGEGKGIWDARFAKYQPLNLGFSGDRTEHVLWRLQNGAVEGLHPKLVILMIGTNNAGHRKEASADTALGIETIVKDLKTRLPDSRILLLAIFPRGEGPSDELRQLCNGTNERIAKLADDKQVFFLDVNARFLDKDGNLPADVMPDKLHPNRKGYEIWADAVEQRVQELVSR
ncbi:MAG: acetylglucosamine-6-sulfatase [Planctomycetes bacterium]|nr:acetylglucosamine-6-sulfatase [Planctomycetota bacterium]